MCKNLEWCINRSMEYANKKNFNQAIASFMSDAKKTECTKHIMENGMMAMIILQSYTNAQDFEQQGLRGFANCCVCSK